MSGFKHVVALIQRPSLASVGISQKVPETVQTLGDPEADPELGDKIGRPSDPRQNIFDPKFVPQVQLNAHAQFTHTHNTHIHTHTHVYTHIQTRTVKTERKTTDGTGTQGQCKSPTDKHPLSKFRLRPIDCGCTQHNMASAMIIHPVYRAFVPLSLNIFGINTNLFWKNETSTSACVGRLLRG